jgi:hypothetical protein
MKPHYYFLSLLFLCLISCDKNSDVLYLDPFHPDQEQFRSSLFIEVVNSSGNPLANTQIRIGNYKRETDNKGFLYLKDVLVGASTYLIAEKDGYFHASRRFYPTGGSSQYIKLIMLSDSRDAFFSSGSGVALPVTGGITLHFPKNAYEFASGASYDGIVVVSAKVIAADDPNLSYKMPGDLTGIDVNGETGSLASMGMVAVELKSSEGSLLRLKAGTQVQMDMVIPTANVGKAPSIISMWYFDENEGIWKEEGSATLTGNVYTANVSHFSYWNYDAWFPAIKWGASFDFGNRGLASQLEVCITIISMNTTKCAYTNSEGMVCGLVAANELLLMEVKNECGDVIYSEEIGPFSDATKLGPITLSDLGMLLTIVLGQAVSCDGKPILNGAAIISVGDLTLYTPLDEASGTFNVSISTCEEDDISVLVVDGKNNTYSIQQNFQYAPVIDADTIPVCETNQELIDIEIVGFSKHYYFYFPSQGEDEHNFITATDNSQEGSHFVISFKGDKPGVYIDDIHSYGIKVELPGEGWFTSNEDIIITVDKFGDVGDYIYGTLSGTCHAGNPGSSGPQYPLLGTFAVLREE